MAKTVRAPDGVEWRVARHWAPWTVRWRGHRPDSVAEWADAPILFGDDLASCLGSIAAWIGIAFVIVLAVAFVLPALVFVVELVLALTIVGVAFLWRIVFRKPWLVTAASNRTVHRQWKRVGWRASGHLAEQVATAIERGQPLPF